MVMEFIGGESLKEVIQHQAPLAVARACRIAKQVAAALDAAHRMGMIHRDIKPGNILLSRPAAGARDSEEVAKVLDFGIAKIREAQLSAGGATLTRTGTSMGTPAYMSPEQAMGKTGEGLDGRTDLYSLGVVMYEMLSGELPIQADSEVQMLIGQINTVPEPIRSRRPDLPEAIAAVVMRCLEKDPARRPASGAALIAQIENYEKGGAAAIAPDDVPTVATRRPVLTDAGSPAPAGRPSRFVGVAALLALVGIAVAFAWYLTSRPKQIGRAPATGTPVTGQPATGTPATDNPLTASQPAPEDTDIPTPPPAQPQQVPAVAPARERPAAPRHRRDSTDDEDADPDDVPGKLDGLPLDAATKAQIQDIWRQASALMKKGDFDGAAAQYQRLSQLRPGWAPAIAALGSALAAKGNSAAAAQLGELARSQPKVAMGHYHHGKALGKAGDLDGDLREQQEAVRAESQPGGSTRATRIYSRAPGILERCGSRVPRSNPVESAVGGSAQRPRRCAGTHGRLAGRDRRRTDCHSAGTRHGRSALPTRHGAGARRRIFGSARGVPAGDGVGASGGEFQVQLQALGETVERPVVGSALRA